jgi:hypothetical protein
MGAVTAWQDPSRVSRRGARQGYTAVDAERGRGRVGERATLDAVRMSGREGLSEE